MPRLFFFWSKFAIPYAFPIPFPSPSRRMRKILAICAISVKKQSTINTLTSCVCACGSSLSFSIFISALPLHHLSPRWPTPPSAGERANRLLPSPCEQLETYLFSHYLYRKYHSRKAERDSEILVQIVYSNWQLLIWPLPLVMRVELVGFRFQRVCYSLGHRKHALGVCSSWRRTRDAQFGARL